MTTLQVLLLLIGTTLLQFEQTNGWLTTTTTTILTSHAGVRAKGCRSSTTVLNFIQKPHRESAFGESIDIDKAEDMADHFGKYPLEDVEEMRSALHTDRIQHFADEKAGYRSNLNPDDEIGRLLLEEDLDLQARLLKDVNVEGAGLVGTPPFAMDGTMAIQHHIPPKEKEENLHLENQVNAFFTLGTGVPEAVMLCLAVLVVMNMPHEI